jgi:hypothetical protein
MVEDPELVQVGLSHGVYGTAAYTLGDQDIQAMHGVEVAMETSEKGWRGSYYLPTPSDAGVAGFRGWMDRHAGGGVQWAKGVTDDASKVKPLVGTTQLGGGETEIPQKEITATLLPLPR